METRAPVYAGRGVAEEARRLGVRCIEVEVARRISQMTTYERNGRRAASGYRLHGPGWTATVKRTSARLNPDRRAWMVTGVRAA